METDTSFTAPPTQLSEGGRKNTEKTPKMWSKVVRFKARRCVVNVEFQTQSKKHEKATKEVLKHVKKFVLTAEKNVRITVRLLCSDQRG